MTKTIELTIPDATFYVGLKENESGSKVVNREQCVAHVDVQITYTSNGQTSEFPVGIPIGSLWVDPYLNVAIKSMMKVDKSYLQHASFIKALAIQGPTMMNPTREYFRNMCMFGDRNTGIIRYGSSPGADYRASTYHDDGYISYVVFDTKEKAFAALVEEASKEKMLGGASSINWSILPPDILIEMGMEEIPDVLRRSVPMYLGKMEAIFGKHEYGREARQRKTKKIEKFYDQIQDALTSPKAA